MRRCSYLPLVTALVFGLFGCGEGEPADGASDAASAGSSSSSSSSSGGDTTPEDTKKKVAIETTDINVTVQVKAESMALRGTIHYPADCQPASPCPLVVIVADRGMNAYPSLEGAADKLAGQIHGAVVVFNLPGMGPGSLKSGGSDDFGGPNHVAAVKEVMKLLSKRQYIDSKRTGYVAIGTGLIPVARALKLHGNNTLKSVQFLIDVEGPTDRCAISQSPEDKDKGIGPNDGPGVTDSACHFDSDAPHSAIYPAAKDGKPASIVCSPGAWPITKTGEDCKATSWWAGREPVNELKSIRTRYQRLQFKDDHRQPSHFSSRHAYSAVASSTSNWFIVNNLPPCKSLPSEDYCEKNPCWLSGAWGTGMAPAPFRGDDYAQISSDALFEQVLPGYILRIMDEVKFKACK
jgi:hypothetical protein